MGGDPYWYFVKYNKDINQVLQELREREFKAGRYSPVTWLEFPLKENTPSPGPQHASIEEALESSAPDGTRSILDMMRIGNEPDCCVAVPADEELLEEIYGTTKPTREMIESNMDIIDDLNRGCGLYVVVYKEGKPSEIFFAGYSFD